MYKLLLFITLLFPYNNQLFAASDNYNSSLIFATVAHVVLAVLVVALLIFGFYSWRTSKLTKKRVILIVIALFIIVSSRYWGRFLIVFFN